VFAGSHYAAAGAPQVMRNRGLRAPRDIALVGFGDMAFAPFQISLQRVAVADRNGQAGRPARSRTNQ
jgi:DNA-binding LacI/PurR family transcriptional regulator